METHEGNAQSSALVEQLTRRERAILLELAEEISYGEIAAREVLALSTVKWYIQQIYRKLGVNNRREALKRARSLSLLASPGMSSAAGTIAAEAPASRPRTRRDLPAGTVTFLFTDIQGSTPLWEREPKKMAAALKIHDAALYKTIETCGGVVFKTVGDAFQAVFPTAPQALKAAIEGQKALHAAPWNDLGELKVRMGLHTGEAESDPDRDEYAVSHTKNRAARIISAAHGGQVLLSQETADLVRRVLPVGVSLKDLGEHSLKGMQWPERLYQVGIPGLPQDFPVLETASVHPHNLPVQVTSFIGREKEIDSVTRLLASHRMVTLTGSGGTGKSRLSLQVAAHLLDHYPNGVWLVELAPLADPGLIPKTVATILNLPEIPGKPIDEALVNFLRSKRLLLILDNCEHLLEDCASLADRLIHACPDLAILASSREFLGVEGEMPYRVPPMALPDPNRLPPLEELATFDAVRLFAERARVVSPDFTVAESNAAAVAQVVTRLDGIPMAIELVAARLRLLGLDQLIQRLNDAFRLLTGGSRSRLPRHQTLRASIDWSYHLLSEPERILLRRLSVFADGWRLQAAEQVCAFAPENCQPVCPEDILDLLSALVDKSLVIPNPESAGRLRYKMLETVRQYAHEKLVDAGESPVVRTRHLAYYLGLGEGLAPKMRGREMIQTLDRLELELDNLRLALEWALQTEVEAGLRLATALQWFWHIRFHWLEGIGWLEQGLGRERSLPAMTQGEQARAILRARALTALGFQRLMQIFNFDEPHHVRVKQILEESVGILKGLKPEQNREIQRDFAWALLWLGGAYNVERDFKHALEHLQPALDLFREIGDLHGIDESLQALGNLELDPIRAKQMQQEQLAVAQAAGDIERVATAHVALAIRGFQNGDYLDCLEVFELSLDEYRQAQNPHNVVEQTLDVGRVALYIGDYRRSEEMVSQALIGFRNLGIDGQVAASLWVRCFLEVAEGRYTQAAEMIAEAWRIYQKINRPSIAADVRYVRARLARLRGDAISARQHAEELRNLQEIQADQKMRAFLELSYLALEQGDLSQAHSLLQGGFQVLVRRNDFLWTFEILDPLALLARRQDQVELAARLFSSRWWRGYFHLLSPSERLARSAILADMQVTLGEERFAQLSQEGQALAYMEMLGFVREYLAGSG